MDVIREGVTRVNGHLNHTHHGPNEARLRDGVDGMDSDFTLT